MKEEENQLLNAIISLSQEIKGMKNTMQEEIGGLRREMNEQLGKVNVLLAEHSRSILTLANKFDEMHSDVNNLRGDMHKLDNSFNKYASSNNDKVNNHETRITRIENRPSVVSEPKAIYKTKKKKK